MSAPPAVTVLLANWNGARFLDEAIASVVAQTHTDWELVAVDTGSDDGSPAILRRWAERDARIRPLFIDERMSCPRALNIGIERSASPFIARIESDDQWEPGRLAAQMRFLARPENARVGVCGTAATQIAESGAVIGLKGFPESHEECLRMIWYRTPFCHSSVIVRREVFADCGGYSEDWVLCEDLEMWFRAGRRFELRNLPQPLTRYRIWAGSLTTRRLATLAWRSRVIRTERARALGYRVPLGARLYSFFALGAALLPPPWVRWIFETAVRRFGPHAGIAAAAARPSKRSSSGET